jgi:hypothetical protein
MTDPDLGSRRLVTLLARDCGIAFKRKHVQHLCRQVGIAAGSPLTAAGSLLKSILDRSSAL